MPIRADHGRLRQRPAIALVVFVLAASATGRGALSNDSAIQPPAQEYTFTKIADTQGPFFNFPHYQVVSVNVIYLFGAR